MDSQDPDDSKSTDLNHPIRNRKAEGDQTGYPFARRLGVLTILTGVSIVLGCTWYLQEKSTLTNGWLFLCLISGMLLFLIGWKWLNASSPPQALEKFINMLAQWLGVQDWQVYCLGFSLVFSILTCLAAGTEAKMKYPVLAVLLWLAAIILATVGAFRFSHPESHQDTYTSKNLPRRYLIFLILGLFIFAFLLRAVNTTHIPVTLAGDEGSSGLMAVEFIQGKFNNIFRTAWFSFPALFFYIQSIPIRWFGQTIPALRLLSAFIGALTVVGVFYFGRDLFNWKVGLFAGVFLAVFHHHINFSRIGLNNIWDAYWFVFVLGFLWRGWIKEERLSFIAAGLGLGFAQYFYVTSRVLALIVLVWLFIAGLLDQARLRRSFSSIFLMMMIAFVIFLPLGWFYIRFPEEFMAPLNRVTIFGDWLKNTVNITGESAWIIILKQIRLGMLGFTQIPLRVWYQPGTPLLRLTSAVLFLLGLGLLILRPRDPRTYLLWVWVLTFGLITGLSESAPAAQRYVAVAPAAALLVGFSLSEIIDQFSRVWRSYRWVFLSAGILLMVWIAYDEINFYFRIFTPRSDFGGDHTRIAQDLAYRLQGLDSTWEVYFFGAPYMGYRSISTLPYLAPHIEGFEMVQPWGNPENPLPGEGNMLFVFLNHRLADLSRVESAYPNGTLLEVTAPGHRVLYRIYAVDKSEEK